MLVVQEFAVCNSQLLPADSFLFAGRCYNKQFTESFFRTSSSIIVRLVAGSRQNLKIQNDARMMCRLFFDDRPLLATVSPVG